MRTRSLLLAFALSSTLPAAPLPELRVAENHRELVTKDGKPFLYLADTAWEMFHRLSREEAGRYLEDRASKGFNVVQAVALAEFGGLTIPNRDGELPLEDNDPARPREAYFRTVDAMVQRSGELGLYVALVPTWGDKVNKKWGQGPEIFTPENARVFGEWLGRRYRDSAIIWIIGGDRQIENERHREIWRAMAAGLRAGDEGRHLMTYHPSGGRTSSEFVHSEPWLDFNMMQSGHAARNAANWRKIAKDLALTPPKPTLDGEPCYEDHPVRGDKTKTQWFGEWDVRKLCYWGLFAGAAGHTYGTHSIWGFWTKPEDHIADQRTPWPEALKLPGATQVGLARRLLESRPLGGRLPAQELLADDRGEGPEHCQSLRAGDSSWAMIYTATGLPVTIRLETLPAQRLQPWWWNPRTGIAARVAPVKNRGQSQEFTPPESGPEKDWVLVLDDETRHYPDPSVPRG